MRGSGVVLFLASAALLAAADPTPADPEAAAKKDLAAIRSTVAPSDPAAALPSLNLQEVGPLPAAEHPAPSLLLAPEGELGPDGLKKKKEGTGNWLVDAMERDQKADKAAAPGRDRDDLLKSDGDLVRGDEKGVTRPEKEGQPFDQSREKAEAAVAAAPVYNPLESFMSSWISAKDHDLLRRRRASARRHGPAATRASSWGRPTRPRTSCRRWTRPARPRPVRTPTWRSWTSRRRPWPPASRPRSRSSSPRRTWRKARGPPPPPASIPARTTRSAPSSPTSRSRATTTSISGS